MRMPAHHNFEQEVMTLKYVLDELHKIIKQHKVTRYQQDEALLNFIKYSYVNLGSDHSNQVRWSAKFRSFVFHLHQFAKQIPSRPPQGFWSYFGNKKSRGELYDAVCILHNNIVKSEIYQNFRNVDKLIALAVETGYLDLSYCVLNLQHLDKISTLNKLKALVISNVVVMVDGKILPLFKAAANHIILFINRFVSLDELDLSENDFSLLSDKELRDLRSCIKNLQNLSSFRLKNCRINDSLLIQLFNINKRGNIFSDIEALSKLRYLDLSCNNIRFDDYHQEEDDKREIDKTVCQEQFLRGLRSRNIKVDLSFNHICTTSTRNRKHKPSPIFDHFDDIMKTDQGADQIFKVESIINSNYLIDRYNSLAVIADDIAAEHAIILVESIDENAQHQIMMYHLRKKSENSCDVKVEIKTFNDGDYSYFKDTHYKALRYGKFYTIDTEKLNKLEKRINDDKNTNIDKSLYQLHFSCCDSAINCFRYCLEVFKSCIDSKIDDPWVAIPRFNLNNIAPIPSAHGRFCFEVPNSLTLSSTNNDKSEEKLVSANIKNNMLNKLSDNDRKSKDIEPMERIDYVQEHTPSM